MAGPADLLIAETDGFAADFTYYILPITGTLAATETGADAAAIAAAVEVEGALAGTETGADGAAFAIVHTQISGVLAATEVGVDGATIVGGIGIVALLAATEIGSDVAAFAIGHFASEANLTLASSRSGVVSLAGLRATSTSLRGGM